MASGLLLVLDDMGALLDDVAAMSKVAAKKTAGIVGDDLAVNANVVVGLDPSRELPIVGKIALGSLANKAILIPLALALPNSLIEPLLVFGGAFLCYEAFHKIAHSKSEAPETPVPSEEAVDPKKLESQKVWGAIGTDAILSAEVIAVALGAVATAPLSVKALTLTVVGLGMTVGVYGLVAMIVKVDDFGLYLQATPGQDSSANFRRSLGRGLVTTMPKFMKLLSVLGTVAMFAVGGGIIAHAFPAIEHAIKPLGAILEFLIPILLGVVVGLVASVIVGLVGKLRGKKASHHQ